MINWLVKFFFFVLFFCCPCAQVRSVELWSIHLTFCSHTHTRRHAQCILHAFEPLLHVLFCLPGLRDNITFLHIFHTPALISNHAWIISPSGWWHKYCIPHSLTEPLPPSSWPLTSPKIFSHLGCFYFFPFLFFFSLFFPVFHSLAEHTQYMCVRERWEWG